MELRDLVVTPVLLVIVFVTAYLVRPYFTDQINRKYFIPALLLKIIGAVSLGFIYQFYYNGGDTFNFHTYGSRVIWNSFGNSVRDGLGLLWGEDIYKYSSKILFFKDPQSFFVIRIAAFFDLLTFSTYSATAILFSMVSFVGSWMLFLVFYRRFQSGHLGLAISCLFIPSVLFWTSGVLKDTLVFAALGILTFELDRLFIQKRSSIGHVILFLLSIYFIFSIKKFLLQAFLPSAMVWVFMSNLSNIRSIVVRAILFPFFLVLIVVGAYYAALKVGEGDSKYSLDKIAETAKITAYDIRFYTGKNAGSGYDLGELDGSINSMVLLAPSAINVTLFRPYLWEANNPLMLMSALESTFFLGFLVFILVAKRGSIFQAFNPEIVFCLLFTIVFSFAVGVSTFNFGTLARYKTPMIPFFLVALTLLYQHYSSNSRKKLLELEETE